MNFIFLGDSLMQPNGEDTYPQTGWPQALPEFLKKDSGVVIQDYALNGRSTKSFLDEGRFAQALEIAKPGDVCFISFGHNDEKSEDPTRYTTPYGTYMENLIFMENEMRKKGVKTIFLTSVTRLKYVDGQLQHTHMEYPDAMKKTSEQLKDPLVDLEELTFHDLSKHEESYNQQHYMILKPGEYPNYPEGKTDRTHMQKNGARWICSLVVPEFKKIPLVAEYFA
jgi:lysophospholipase L1-like esterase